MARIARILSSSDDYNTLVLSLDSKISFVLLSEADLEKWPDREFQLRGPDFELNGRTDDEGLFEHEPVQSGEYDLYVGDAKFVIPAVSLDESPHPIQIPYDMLPDIRDAWPGPTEEELQQDEEPVPED
jgi:hypothetical protein